MKQVLYLPKNLNILEIRFFELITANALDFEPNQAISNGCAACLDCSFNPPHDRQQTPTDSGLTWFYVESSEKLPSLFLAQLSVVSFL